MKNNDDHGLTAARLIRNLIDRMRGGSDDEPAPEPDVRQNENTRIYGPPDVLAQQRPQVTDFDPMTGLPEIPRPDDDVFTGGEFDPERNVAVTIYGPPSAFGLGNDDFNPRRNDTPCVYGPPRG